MRGFYGNAQDNKLQNEYENYIFEFIATYHSGQSVKDLHIWVCVISRLCQIDYHT